jgi:hypothetical protein
MYLAVQGKLDLKISDQNMKNVTRGGGGKVQKSVTYYLNDPLQPQHAF